MEDEEEALLVLPLFWFWVFWRIDGGERDAAPLLPPPLLPCPPPATATSLLLRDLRAWMSAAVRCLSVARRTPAAFDRRDDFGSHDDDDDDDDEDDDDDTPGLPPASPLSAAAAAAAAAVARGGRLPFPGFGLEAGRRPGLVPRRAVVGG